MAAVSRLHLPTAVTSTVYALRADFLAMAGHDFADTNTVIKVAASSFLSAERRPWTFG